MGFEDAIRLRYESPGFGCEPVVCDAFNPYAFAVEEDPLDALVVAAKRPVAGDDLEGLEVRFPVEPTLIDSPQCRSNFGECLPALLDEQRCWLNCVERQCGVGICSSRM